jgi:hypothetical protein
VQYREASHKPAYEADLSMIIVALHEWPQAFASQLSFRDHVSFTRLLGLPVRKLSPLSQCQSHEM